MSGNSITDAFKKLRVTNDVTVGDHENIFNVSYQYLSKVKHFQDLKAFKNVLVASINLDKYHKANEILKKLPKEYESSLILEIGYIYYKLGNDKSLIELYKKHESQLDEVAKIGLNHILAQTYYKIGSYKESLNLYQQLIQNNNFDNALDLIINEKAVISALNFQQGNKIQSDYDSATDSYDLLFNQALIELSNFNISKSLNLLNRAVELCESINLNESDLENELLPIKLTISYIFQINQQFEKSYNILKDIDVSKINDLMIRLIIKNNKYSQQELKNSNFIDRDLNYLENLHKLNQKLTNVQYEIILKNSILLRFQTGTLSKSQLNSKFIKEYNDKFPGDALLQAYRLLINLGIDYKDLTENPKSTGRKLIKYINSTEEKEIPLLLLIHLNSKLNNYDQGLPILENLVQINLNSKSINPSLIGSLITIYESKHLTTKLVNLFKTLIEKFLYTSESSFSIDNYNTAKIIAFKSINYKELKESSRQLFEFLYQINPNDNLIESILESKNDGLLPIEDLISSKPIDEILNIDMNELLPNNKLVKPIVKKLNKVVKKHKKAKFGKNKVVKPIDEVELDDERWIPLKLRSYYKPTKKDKKKVNNTQGESTNTNINTNTTQSSANKKKKKKGKK
ncbi:unnamed protein product [Candida verbasci]|uniref:Signal recognition particle subunit SRP72 n=1 Tax=Candida verbasci TaxID=1227364 RepID=A0A9W4TZX3_9ASCO|nr:unnamed protein product [Candida verbasci]